MKGKPGAWTPEEKAAVFAAVEQCRATGGRLDWCAIAATVPGHSAQAVRRLYYNRAPAPVSPPPIVFRRPCLRCHRPFDSLDRKRNWICSPCRERIAVGSIAA